MTTLFIYGDSFGADWNANWQWHRQLVAMLNTNGKGITRVVNQSVSGCSNDYSFDLFSRDRQKPGDVVLFLLTEPSRQTFWMEKPHVGNLRSITDTDTAVIGIELQIPIYSGGKTSSAYRQASFRYDSAKELLEKEERSIRRRVRESFLGVPERRQETQ